MIGHLVGWAIKQAPSRIMMYDRNDFAKWESLGKLSMEERAHQIVLDTIQNYVTKSLTAKQEKGVQEILDAADAASKIKE